MRSARRRRSSGRTPRARSPNSRVRSPSWSTRWPAGKAGPRSPRRSRKIALLKVEPAAEPMTKERFLAGYTGFRILINRRHPDQVRQLLRKLGCDRIVVTTTATGWDFAGEIDAGRIRATPPQEPDLIETDAACY